MDKKHLFIVLTRFQLLTAFHIRNTILAEESWVDIIVSGEQFNSGYADRLKTYFHNVYRAEQDYFKRKDRFMYWFNPLKALRTVGINRLEDYSDVYYYNQGWIWYYLCRDAYKRQLSYRWHIIQDGMANYTIDLESAFFTFRGYENSFIQAVAFFFDRNMRTQLLSQSFDEYLWDPELCLYSLPHNIIKIPMIDQENQEYLNQINYMFDFRHKVIDSRIIYLDGGYGYGYDSYNRSCLANLIGSFGDQITVIPHPSTEKGQMERIGIKVGIFTNESPWELYCLNGMTDEKIIISSFSGALINPISIFGFDQDVYALLVNPENKGEDEHSERIDRLRRLMIKADSIYAHYHCVESIDEMVEIIKSKMYEDLGKVEK